MNWAAVNRQPSGATMSSQDPSAHAAAFELPADFEFMVQDAWLAFHRGIDEAVAGLELEVASIDPGVIRLRSGRSLTLLQLAQHCHARPRDEWADLIVAHLRTMTAHLDQIAEPSSMFDLRIRLVPDTPTDAAVLRQLGGRPFADGIVQVLAVDVDDAVRCVPTSEVAAHGWDVDEAWASALAQTELLEVPDEIHVIDIGGAEMIHVFGERPFIAGMIGAIDDVIAEYAHIGERGAIVSMPIRHSVLVHPIDDSTVRPAIAGMIPITRQLFKQGPGSVSPHLYWWRDGALEWIPTFFDGTPSGVEVYPSSELSDLVADLTR
jgi:hypothetical protein